MPPKKPPPRPAAAVPKTEPPTDGPPISAPASEEQAATPTPGRDEATPSAATTPAASRPGSLAPRGRGGRPIARPRGVGRRSQTARAELEKQEAERKRVEAEAKAKEEARFRRRDAARSRGAFRGRQRGGYMGDGDRKTQEAVASGPFSLGQATSDMGVRRRPMFGGSRMGGGGGGGGGYGGSSGVKREAGGDVDMTDVHIKTEEGGFISSDEEDEGGKKTEKQNVDDLAFIDLTGEDDAPVPSFAPVRLHRVEHKDRTITLNADATTNADGTAVSADSNETVGLKESEKKKGKQKAKDVEITGEASKYRGTYTDSSSEQETEPRIKPEPTDEDDERLPEPMLAGTEPQSPPTSPETKRKAKERIKARSSFSEPGAKPSFQTKEEEVEWNLRQRDLVMLRNELGKLAIPTPAKTTDGTDTAMAGTDGAQQTEQPQESNDPRADKVYLFQFPPILPDLLPITVKPDPESKPADDPDAMDTDKPATTASKPAIIPDENEPPPGSRPPKLPSGMVGKLRIHASGRATLDWGGTPLEIGMGSEASFLQDVLIADLPPQPAKKEEGDVKEEEEVNREVRAGRAMGMGQVKGKFVVTPDWNTILS